MRYAVWSQADKSLKRTVGSLEYDPLTEGYTLIADIYLGDVFWCTELLNYRDIYDPYYVIDPLTFIQRLSLEERVGIHQGSFSSPILKDMLFMLSIVSKVDTCSSETVKALNYLVSVGILTPERASQIKGY
jgi:hypothetical protein